MKLGKYRHYKGKEYEVIALGKHSDTLEDYVVYQGLYNSEEFGNNPIRVKQVKEFEKYLDLDGKKVKRFEYIGK